MCCSLGVLRVKIKKSRIELFKWCKENFDKAEELKNQKTLQLSEIQESEGQISLDAINSLQLEVNELLEVSELKWRHKAKEN